MRMVAGLAVSPLICFVLALAPSAAVRSKKVARPSKQVVLTQVAAVDSMDGPLHDGSKLSFFERYEVDCSCRQCHDHGDCTGCCKDCCSEE
mmetsp:Transcript_72721/g.168521  ORF Transcript_72721/g.168521 Transcript_72721/m.168521 type:complete len:91 (+) Transcript_72721:73-345(+)